MCNTFVCNLLQKHSLTTPQKEHLRQDEVDRKFISN